jgi:radical SAM superfamily enzyme YgiQ (UPF0313 family)
MNIILTSFEIRAINIRLLSSFLKKQRHKVFLLFCPNELDDKSINEIVNFLFFKKIDLFGISLVTDDFLKAKTLSDEIKKKIKIPIIWGGAHPSSCPEECLQYADMVCVGECEEALSELCEQMEKKKKNYSIKNILFKQENEIIYNPLRHLTEDLDSFPFQDYNFKDHFILQNAKIQKFKENLLNQQYDLIASRGCPFSCSYCYNNARRKLYFNLGKYLRERSVENILLELRDVKNKFKLIKQINLWDDNFLNRGYEELKIFAKSYKKYINLPLFCLANPNYVDENKIKILKECGLSKMQVGIQTGSERINKHIYSRPVSNKNILNLAKLLTKYKISVIYDIIFNNPYESKEDIKETIKLLLKFPKPINLQGFNLIYYPGSQISDRAIKDNYIIPSSRTEELSKIQSPSNSPLSEINNTTVSNRFYQINYSIDEKKYLNTLIALIQYYPRIIIRILLLFDNPIVHFLANQLIILRKLYGKYSFLFRRSILFIIKK